MFKMYATNPKLSSFVLYLQITAVKPPLFFGGIKEWCIAWWHSGREESDDGFTAYEQEEPSDLGYATPVSIETPLPSSVSR